MYQCLLIYRSMVSGSMGNELDFVPWREELGGWGPGTSSLNVLFDFALLNWVLDHSLESYVVAIVSSVVCRRIFTQLS